MTAQEKYIITIHETKKEKPALIADFEKSPIFYNEEIFYYGEKIRLQAEKNNTIEKIHKYRIKAEKNNTPTEEKNEALKKTIVLENDLSDIVSALKYFDDVTFNVDIIDEIKIRLLLRKNGVNIVLFREDVAPDERAAYEIALKNFYNACSTASKIQCALKDGELSIEDLQKQKNICRNLSKKVCDCLTGVAGENNKTKVFSVSAGMLSILIDTMPTTRKTKQKNVEIIKNKARYYIDVQSFKKFSRLFEDFIAQQLEKLDTNAPDQKPKKTKKKEKQEE